MLKIQQEPQIIERLWENTRFFKAGLKELGFNTGLSESPITPVIVGEAALAMQLSDRLFEHGVFAQGIGFPTVARDKAKRSAVKHVMETFFNGSAEQIVAALLDVSSTRLTHEELDRMSEMIERAKREEK